MINLKTYESFLNEGGWETVKTQSTSITPDVIKSVVDIIDRIAKGFNSHLRELELPSLDFLKPIGSGSWWQEDLKDQPDKTYGDVDFMVAYPTLKLTSGSGREDEIATVKLYNQELLMWLEAENPKGIDIEETKNIANISSLKIVLEVSLADGSLGYVQVDLVITHKEYQDWAVFRMTPMRNVKGFVIGNLYSAFGKVLDLSIQTRGVRAKFEGDVMKPYSSRKNVEERDISISAKNFMSDIARFFWEKASSNMPFENTPIQSWKGMDPNNPRFEDFCEGIRLVAKTLSVLDEFGTTIKYKSERDLLKAVFDVYKKKMMTTYTASKFDKAKTPAAFAAIEKIRSLIDKYVKLAEVELLKK